VGEEKLCSAPAFVALVGAIVRMYFVFTIWFAIDSGIFGTLPFLMIYLCGYAYAAVMSIAQARMNLRKNNSAK
jgi:hypothetical protein